MTKNIVCKLCNKEFSYISGHFSIHLRDDHFILDRKQYIIQTEYGGITPKCKCGYCEEDATFLERQNKFVDINKPHRKYDWIENNYIKKYGEPKCITCGEITNFKRGIPNNYCSHKCVPGQWNQTKVNKTVMNKYGVKNVFQLDSTKKKIQNSIMLKYNVIHYSKTNKHKNMVSINGVKNISKFNTKLYKNTNLYYQSTYEYNFLEYCENNNILNLISRCKFFKFTDTKFGLRFRPDFYIEKYNLIIEIKSTYISKLQGGKERLDAIRKVVEDNGYNYMLLMDNDLNEFKKLLMIG